MPSWVEYRLSAPNGAGEEMSGLRGLWTESIRSYK